MYTAFRAFVLCVLLALASGALPVRAETISCTAITALPAIITVQGIYCFTGHLNTAMPMGNAIDIQTNNVVLDLNGDKVGGLAAGPGTSTDGIHAVNRQNITIKNGTIRGFLRGIDLEDTGPSQGHIVEDIRADQNTYIGIDVRGAGNIVRNNQVVATGGTTIFGADANAYGIFVVGNGPRVLNHDVIKVVGTGGFAGLGIYLDNVTGGVVVNNRITEAFRGIDFDVSTGKYRDNVTSAVNYPFYGGTDIGNNN